MASVALPNRPVSLATEPNDSLRFPQLNGNDKISDGQGLLKARKGRPFLTVSPYLEPQHLLDLRTLDLQNQFLALALTDLATNTSEYASTTYPDAFNFPALMSTLRRIATSEKLCWLRREFYVVEFKSILKDDVDRDLLFALDKESHREATESGGLLKYWYGRPDNERRNLATCFWRSKKDAIKGGEGPWHRRARGIIPKMYERIEVRGLRLVIEDDVREWHFEPFH